MKKLINRYWWVAFFLLSGTVLLEEGSYLRLGDMQANSISQLKTYHPYDGLSIKTLAYSISRQGGGGRYIYSVMTTGSGNDMDSVKPSNGLPGMWILQPENNVVLLTQFGGVGDSSTDNTAALQAMVNYSARTGVWGTVPYGVFLINPTTPVIMKDHMRLTGVDINKSIIMAKAYSGQGKDMFYADTIHDAKFTLLTINGLQKFTGTVISGTTILDTNYYAIKSFQADSLSITKCILKNAMNIVFFSNGHDNMFNYNYWDSIGNNAISTSYGVNIQRCQVVGNVVHHFDIWESWSTIANKRQEGNDFLTSGGTRWYVADNWMYNDGKKRWAWCEMGIYGPNWFLRNYVNGYGMNSMGITIDCDKNDQTRIVDGLVYESNVQDSILFDDMKAGDTSGGVVKYWYNSLQELRSINNSSVRFNRWKGSGITLNGKSNNNFIEHNDFIAPDSRSTPGRIGENILLTLGQSSADTIRNTYFRYNTGILATSEIVRCTSNGATIDGLHVDYNNMYGSTALLPGELYGNGAGVAPINFTFNGNFIRGTLGGGYVFYTSNTGTSLKIIANDNNFISSDVDTITNMVTSLGGTTSTINLTGSKFSWGTYTYTIDSLRNNFGVIEGRRNGLWKPQMTRLNNTVIAVTGTVTLLQVWFNLVQVDVATSTSGIAVNLPTSPSNGDIVRIVFGGTIAAGSPVATSFSVSGNGHTLYGTTAPTTMNGGDVLEYSYSGANATWYRIKL